MGAPKVAILMGSNSDVRAMCGAAEILDEFKVPYSFRILSAHRTPNAAAEFAENAHNEFDVIICGAGMAAHLAGAVAAKTHLPVIGVPLSGSSLNGFDALYATVQMPAGMPVATVAIDNAANAGILAVQILALYHPSIKEKFKKFRDGQTEKTVQKDRQLEEIGWRKWLETH